MRLPFRAIWSLLASEETAGARLNSLLGWGWGQALLASAFVWKTPRHVFRGLGRETVRAQHPYAPLLLAAVHNENTIVVALPHTFDEPTSHPQQSSSAPSPHPTSRAHTRMLAPQQCCSTPSLAVHNENTVVVALAGWLELGAGRRATADQRGQLVDLVGGGRLNP